MINELNDSLDDLLSAPAGEVRGPVNAPAEYKPRDFTENCVKCRGTGRFVGYSGRSFGQCFACKGAGNFTFKTSPETRAKARTAKADRTASRENDALTAFAAANPELWAHLSGSDSDFSRSLVDGIKRFGDLTAGQRAAVERGIVKDAARKAEAAARVQNAPLADTAGVDRLKAAFDFAIAKATEKGRGLRQPRITVGGMVISPAKATSTNPGALYVKNGAEYLGKVAGGRFFAARECGPDQEKKVLAFIADPKAAAIAYGQETGVCCICNATLTNEASMAAGIGPVCAANFGW